MCNYTARLLPNTTIDPDVKSKRCPSINFINLHIRLIVQFVKKTCNDFLTEEIKSVVDKFNSLYD